MGKLIKLSTLLALIIGASNIQAQVHKCVDESGHVTFSSAGCDVGSVGSKVYINQTNVADGSSDRQLAAEQEIKRQQELEERRQRRNQTVIIGQQPSSAEQRRRMELCREARSPYKGSPKKQLTARQRAMAEQCNSGARVSEIERTSTEYKERARREAQAMPSAPPAPTHITNCDAGGCWDNTGQRYNSGGGPVFIRQDGRPCVGAGNMMDCN